MSHKVTPRDSRLFKTLTVCRAMTTHQIRAVFYPGPSASRCWMRLKFLTDAGLLKRIEQPSLFSEGRKPYVHILTRKSYQLIDPEGEPEKFTVTYPFLSHILDISEGYTRFAVAAKSYTLDWMNEVMLKRAGMIDRFDVVSMNGTRHNAAIVPDAYMLLTTPERDFRFLIEVDRGMEQLKEVAMKVVKYRTYFTPPDQQTPSLYERRYGTDKGRVLFITHSLPRLLNLKKVCEEQGGRARYWFSLFTSLQTSDPFTAPIWYKAGAAEKFTLL